MALEDEKVGEAAVQEHTFSQESSADLSVPVNKQQQLNSSNIINYPLRFLAVLL